MLVIDSWSSVILEELVKLEKSIYAGEDIEIKKILTIFI